VNIDEWIEATRVEVFSELNYTVGYHESSHKDEVTKGAKILWGKVEVRMREALQRMERDVGYEKAQHDEVKADLKTLAGIIRKHASE
jgi:hypothetical protein